MNTNDLFVKNEDIYSSADEAVLDIEALKEAISKEDPLIEKGLRVQTPSLEKIARTAEFALKILRDNNIRFYGGVNMIHTGNAIEHDIAEYEAGLGLDYDALYCMARVIRAGYEVRGKHMKETAKHN
jgi:hypothetical protein